MCDLTMLSLYRRCILYVKERNERDGLHGAKNPEETDDDDVMSTAAAPAAAALLLLL